MTEEAKRRKRNRSTVVCQRCRSKKAKCDKTLPCGACVKAKRPEACVYESHVPTHNGESPLLTKAQVEVCTRHFDENPEQLRLDAFDPPSTKSSSSTGTTFSHIILESNDYLVGINPVIPSTNMINMHMDFSTPMAYFNTLDGTENQVPGFYMFRHYKRPQRPTGFMELSQQEPGTKLFWRQRTKHAMTLETQKCFESASFREELTAATKVKFGENYIPSMQEAQALQLGIKQIHRRFSNYGQYCGLSYDNVPADSCLLDTLKATLPDKYSILGYAKRFFEVIYPIYPVLDQAWVNYQISNIFRFSSEGELVDVSITSHSDELVVSIILFMLRMSFLSFFDNTASVNETVLLTVKPPYPGSKLLKDCQISLSVVSLASNFIDRGSRGMKVLLLTLQANLMRCVLKMCASESEMGFSTLRTSFNHAQLIQMASSLSMERDPSYVIDFARPNERACNLKRKIWYVLVRLDFTMSYLFSSPRLIDSTLYNTLLPQFSPSASNIEDLNLEKEVYSLMSEIYNVMKSGTTLLHMSQNITGLFKACDCLQELTEFEQRVQDVLGTPSEYFHGEKKFKYTCQVLLTSNLQTQLILKLFIAQIHYFFYLYFKFRDNLDLEYFFLRKVLLIMFLEMNIYCSELTFVKSDLVNSAFFFHMNPMLIMYSNSISLVGIGLFTRLNCSLAVAQSTPGAPQSVHSLRRLAFKCESFVLRKLKLCKLLSERYFQAWKCLKSFGHGCKLMNLPDFLGDQSDLAKAAVSWSSRQQEEMLNLIPEDVPLQMRDVGDIGRFCYYSDRSMEDYLLKGDDLLKTVQTDNFWICMNALAEIDTANFPVRLDIEFYVVPGKGGTSFAESGVVEDTNGQASVPTNDDIHPKYDMSQMPSQADIQRGQAISNFGDESANQIIDYNMFNTDWAIDDFFQGLF